MPPGFLDYFGRRYESAVEDDCAALLVSGSLLHLVAGIPPSLFGEISSHTPALQLVLELCLAMHMLVVGRKLVGESVVTDVILEPPLDISSITTLRALPADRRRKISGFSPSQSITDELGGMVRTTVTEIFGNLSRV
jgi:hypothetical protein